MRLPASESWDVMEFLVRSTYSPLKSPHVGECFHIPDTMPVPAQALGVRSQGHPVSCPEPSLCKGKDDGTIKVQIGIHEWVKQRKRILKTSFLTYTKAWTGKCLPKKKKKAERLFKQKLCVWKEFSCIVKRMSQSWVQIDAYTRDKWCTLSNFGFS